jgi:hypothetical protein
MPRHLTTEHAPERSTLVPAAAEKPTGRLGPIPSTRLPTHRSCPFPLLVSQDDESSLLCVCIYVCHECTFLARARGDVSLPGGGRPSACQVHLGMMMG